MALNFKLTIAVPAKSFKIKQRKFNKLYFQTSQIINVIFIQSEDIQRKYPSMLFLKAKLF